MMTSSFSLGIGAARLSSGSTSGLCRNATGPCEHRNTLTDLEIQCGSSSSKSDSLVFNHTTATTMPKQTSSHGLGQEMRHRSPAPPLCMLHGGTVYWYDLWTTVCGLQSKTIAVWSAGRPAVFHNRPTVYYGLWHIPRPTAASMAYGSLGKKLRLFHSIFMSGFATVAGGGMKPHWIRYVR